MKLNNRCRRCRHSLLCLSGKYDAMIGATSLCAEHCFVFMWTDHDGNDVNRHAVNLGGGAPKPRLGPPPTVKDLGAGRIEVEMEIRPIQFLAPGFFAQMLDAKCNCEAAEECHRLFKLNVDEPGDSDIVDSHKMSHSISTYADDNMVEGARSAHNLLQESRKVGDDMAEAYVREFYKRIEGKEKP